MTRYKEYNKYDDICMNFDNKGCTEWLFCGTFAAHLYSIRLFADNRLNFIKNMPYNEDIIFIRKAIFLSTSICLKSDFLYIYRMNPKSTVHAKIKTQDAFSIPRKWRENSTWCVTFSDISFDSKAEWKLQFELYSDCRYLEAIKNSALAGHSKKSILTEITNDELKYVYELNISDVNALEENDLILCKRNIEFFILKYRIIGLFISIIRFFL